MAGSKKSKAKSKGAESRDSVFFEEVMTFLLLAAGFLSLLWQGLLYESNSIPLVIFLSLASGAVLLKTAFAPGLRQLPQLPQSLLSPRGETPAAGLAAVFFLLITAASALSLAGAVYPHDALYALSKNFSLLLTVLALGILRQKIPLGRWLAKAFFYAGLSVALLGLDAVWGGRLVLAINAFLSGGAPAEGGQGFLFAMESGGRLASVFQYPNTTASFLLAAWFAAAHLHLLPGEIRKSGKTRRKALFLSAGVANLIFLAFVLTVSRGMYLISAPMLLVYMILLPGGETPGGQISGGQKARTLTRCLLCLLPGLVTGIFSLPGAPLRDLSPGEGWLLLLFLFLLCGFAAVLFAGVRYRPVVAGMARVAGAAGAGKTAPGTAPGATSGAEPVAASGKALGVGAGAGKDAASRKAAGAGAGAGPRLMRNPKAAFAFILLGCLCLTLLLGAAWFSSGPLPINAGTGAEETCVRQFQLGEAGDYRLVLSFARPLAGDALNLNILLQGQDRQEMLRGVYTTYLLTDLSAFAGRRDIRLPFTPSGENLYCRLSVSGAGGETDNALVSLSVVSASDTATGTAAGTTQGAAAGTASGSASDTPSGTSEVAASAVPEGTALKIKLDRFLFSEAMVRQIEAIFHPKSMYDRFGFYLDGFRILKDYPLTGIGGNGWRYMYGSYQKHPYISNDPHSFAVQLTVEYGLCGLFIFLGFLLCLFSLFFHRFRRREESDILPLMLAGTLFAHSMIDVDFTYYGQYLVFAMAFAAINFPARQPRRRSAAGPTPAPAVVSAPTGTVPAAPATTAAVSTAAGAAPSPAPSPAPTSASASLAAASPASVPGPAPAPPPAPQPFSLPFALPPSLFRPLRPLRRPAGIAFLAAAFVFGCYWPFCFSRANACASSYFYNLNAGNPAEAGQWIARAAKWDPFKPEYKAAAAVRMAADLGVRETEAARAQAQNLAAKAGAQGRYSGSTILMTADYYFETGQYDEAWEANRRLVEIEPYLNEYWLERGELIEKILRVYAESPEERRRFWLEKGLGIPAEMKALSADRWVAIEPDAALAALIAAWTRELSSF